MKKFLLGTALTCWLTAPANATLQIAFANSGGGSFFCADQTSCDLNGSANNLLLINTKVGDISVEATGAASTSGKLNSLQVSNFTITNNGSGVETLFMAVGDTGFHPPTAFIKESASATTFDLQGAAFNLGFWADQANAQPAATAFDTPGMNLFSVAGTINTSPEAVSGNHTSPFFADSPFSMSEAALFTLQPGQSITGFNQAMTSGVPEPSQWVMLIMGFGLFGFMGLKRRLVID